MKSNIVASSDLSHLISRLGIRQSPLETPAPTEWSLDILSGRFVELSSQGETASISAAVSIILQAQHLNETAAWVTVGASTFFPPDVAEWGVDLDSLPVVQTSTTLSATRTADKLLRSGAFAVVILDLGHDHGMRIPIQSRLAGLAKKHHTVLLCLTKKTSESPSIGSLVSIRGEARVKRTGFDHFTWEIQVLKDKRRGPGWSHSEVCRGPDGLC